MDLGLFELFIASSALVIGLMAITGHMQTKSKGGNTK